ncbi:hypothetical protein [Chitinophaga parva]|uniref:hypothetical protein n=1 Tax=Chitinophaga parva TaxID=2169414 RepID=UPI00140293BE|nr:hypothetical protein [Chitinophaga parva]
MLNVIQPGHQPEQPTQPQPQQPDVPTPNPPQPPPPQPQQPPVPNEVPDHDIKRTPTRPNDKEAAEEDGTPADEKLGPTKDYNPQGKGHYKDRFPFPNSRH